MSDEMMERIVRNIIEKCAALADEVAAMPEINQITAREALLKFAEVLRERENT